MVVIGVVPVTLGGEAFPGCTEIFKKTVIIVQCEFKAVTSILLVFRVIGLKLVR